MSFIAYVEGLLRPGDRHYYMGNGMWTSERAGALVFPSRTEVNEALEGSSWRANALIEEIPDAQEE